VIGAHPSYPDREGFGRRSNVVAGDELRASLRAQIEALQSVAAELGADIAHVKPHGALYNDAARDSELAELIATVIAGMDPDLILVGPPDSALQAAAEGQKLQFLAEAFVDRAYRSDGSLVPRSETGAVHGDITTITTQAIRLATAGEVTSQSGDVIEVAADTLCIHGDTAGAAEVARAVRDVLTASGVAIRAAR